MRVLITGGAGFVGSALTTFLSLTHEVTVFDNFMCGGASLFGLNQIKIIDGDIRDKAAVQRAVTNADTVVHLAGIVGYPACDLMPDLAFDINVTGTENVVASLGDGQKLIYTSSSSCYGVQEGIVTEESELVNLSSYTDHKIRGEQLIKRYSEISGFDYIIFRPATAFGVSRTIRLDLLPNTLIYSALSTGEIDLYKPELIRPFIHVNDFASALKFAVNDKLASNEVYNLGDARMVLSKEELAKIICTKLDVVYKLTDGTDTRSYALSFGKLVKTGFRCTRDINFGIDQLVRIWPVIKDNYEKYTTITHLRNLCLI